MRACNALQLRGSINLSLYFQITGISRVKILVDINFDVCMPYLESRNILKTNVRHILSPVVISCPLLFPDQHTMFVSNEGNMLGQQVVFRCADDYSTDDPLILNCTISGNWSSELPMCTQDQGEPPSYINIGGPSKTTPT